MKRHQPERLARAATAFHCKDWLYFKLTGERATDPAEGIFTFGNFRTRSYEPAICERARHRRLRASAARRSSMARERLMPLTAAAAADDRAAERPAGRARLSRRASAPRSAAGSMIRSGTVGCSIIGSTGMHMRFVPTAPMPCSSTRTAPATPCRFPVPGRYRPDAVQHGGHRSTSTGWSTWRAKRLRRWPASVRIAMRFWPALDAQVLRPLRPAAALYHPYIFEAGERGPFLTPMRGRSSSGLSTQHQLSRACCAPSMRASPSRRAIATAPWARIPSEIRLTGGAARSSSCSHDPRLGAGRAGATVLREETGAAGAAMMAAVATRHLSQTWRLAREAWVTPLLGDAHRRPTRNWRRSTTKLFPIYRSVREAMPPVLGRSRPQCRREATP